MNMKQFGILSTGEQAHVYTIAGGGLRAEISDFGATLVSLWVPDEKGNLTDVVLGFDCAADYAASGSYFGATVGRNANRIQGAAFTLNEQNYVMDPNDNGNNLHSGNASYAFRLWNVAEHREDAIRFCLESLHGDQGFPGNARLSVTYTLEDPGTLRITYDGICDRDTIFNLTNHSYFNLAGHEKTDQAMNQILSMGARVFGVADDQCIPTGELRSVDNSPMDFRIPKAIGRDIDAVYEALNLQGGYDHNFEAFGSPCAILSDPNSGRTMQVVTDCPGIQFYSGNMLEEVGKQGVAYPRRSGICLETQYYPDAIHHPEWAQPVVKAGQRYHSETKYIFT